MARANGFNETARPSGGCSSAHVPARRKARGFGDFCSASKSAEPALHGKWRTEQRQNSYPRNKGARGGTKLQTHRNNLPRTTPPHGDSRRICPNLTQHTIRTDLTGETEPSRPDVTLNPGQMLLGFELESTNIWSAMVESLGQFRQTSESSVWLTCVWSRWLSSTNFGMHRRTLANISPRVAKNQPRKHMFSICACHPCTRAMLIFSASLQQRKPPKNHPRSSKNILRPRKPPKNQRKQN